MNAAKLARLIADYQKANAAAQAVRYSVTPAVSGEYSDIFGLNFEEMMKTPPKEQYKIFLRQYAMQQLTLRLMKGEAVDPAEAEELLGVKVADLETELANLSPVKKAIPEKLVVLCFDDAYKSQYQVARPILKEYGFNATFYITEMLETPRNRPFEDKSVYMTWEEIAELEADGFELGNHSLHHYGDSLTRGHDFNVAEMEGLNAEFAAHGLKRPVSYAYPSGPSNLMAVQCARECGFKWGRGNCGDSRYPVAAMTYYNPLLDSPLSLCNFGDPDFYTEQVLRERIANTPAGTIFGLTYHDVDPKNQIGPMSFAEQMAVLQQLGCRVISMADLEEYIDPEKAYQYTI